MSNKKRAEWGENLIEKFIYAQGKTDVPLSYYRYVAISIIGALLQNKVWVELYPGDPLYPNLYIFLLGPSGVGKGRAISAGVRLLEACGLSDYCGLIGGSLTSAGLMDFLSGKQGSNKAGTSRAYIIHPELASSIKWGEHADSLVKKMTDFYTADLPNYTDGTRTSGWKQAGKPCLSWLAGSTRRWLISNLKADSMAGGFMARGLFVEVFNKPARVNLPEPPADREAVLGELQLQLSSQIYDMEGKMKINDEALDYLQDWFMSRVEPKSEEGQASWNRHRELALKISMVLSAAENGRKVITFSHIYEAVTMVEDLKSTESDLWGYIISGGKVIDLDFVSRKIAMAGEIQHSDLLSAVSGRGILTRRLYELITTLEQSGKVEVGRSTRINNARERSVVVYKWKTKKPNLLTLSIGDDYD